VNPVVPLAITWFVAVFVAMMDGRRRPVQWLAIAALAASLAAHVSLALDVIAGGPQEVFVGGWPAGVGIALRADALGAVFAVVTALVLLICLAYEALGGGIGRAFPSIVLFLATGLSGVFLTGDAFNIYGFFEISMDSAYVLSANAL
jgi:multicomponent Na+:H+ antiporter subunit D